MFSLIGYFADKIGEMVESAVVEGESLGIAILPDKWKLKYEIRIMQNFIKA